MSPISPSLPPSSPVSLILKPGPEVWRKDWRPMWFVFANFLSLGFWSKYLKSFRVIKTASSKRHIFYSIERNLSFEMLRQGTKKSFYDQTFFSTQMNFEITLSFCTSVYDVFFFISFFSVFIGRTLRRKLNSHFPSFRLSSILERRRKRLEAVCPNQISPKQTL